MHYKHLFCLENKMLFGRHKEVYLLEYSVILLRMIFVTNGVPYARSHTLHMSRKLRVPNLHLLKLSRTGFTQAYCCPGSA